MTQPSKMIPEDTDEERKVFFKLQGGDSGPMREQIEESQKRLQELQEAGDSEAADELRRKIEGWKGDLSVYEGQGAEVKR